MRAGIAPVSTVTSANSGRLANTPAGMSAGSHLMTSFFQPRQPVQRALADLGHGFGQRQRLQLRAARKRPRSDGGHGIETDPRAFCRGAVHERLRADGRKRIVVRNGEIFDGLAALEHAVAQPDDRLLGNREVGMDARLCAGNTGSACGFRTDTIPFRGTRGRRVLRAPDAACQPQRVHIRLPFLHLLPGAAVAQVDIRQIIAALKDVFAQCRRGLAVQNDVLNVVIALERIGTNRLRASRADRGRPCFCSFQTRCRPMVFNPSGSSSASVTPMA